MNDINRTARTQYAPPRAAIVKLNSRDVICDSALAQKYSHAGLSDNAFLGEIDDWTDEEE